MMVYRKVVAILVLVGLGWVVGGCGWWSRLAELPQETATPLQPVSTTGEVTTVDFYFLDMRDMDDLDKTEIKETHVSDQSGAYIIIEGPVVERFLQIWATPTERVIIDPRNPVEFCRALERYNQLIFSSRKEGYVMLAYHAGDDVGLQAMEKRCSLSPIIVAVGQ